MNSNIEIVVDSRETSLQNALEHDLVSKQLPVGDILIGNKLLIERKTLIDLVSSIEDGRWHDQLSRMKLFVDTNDESTALVIVEGLYTTECKPSFPIKNVFSALYGALLRDKIPFMASKDINETAYICKHIKSVMQCNKSPSVQTGTPRLRKRASIFDNPIEVAKAQLQVIPGISARISKELLQSHGTLLQFLTHWADKEPSELAQIKINEKKIGNVLASRIFDSLIYGKSKRENTDSKNIES